jgi:hypothetical protein
MNRTIDPTTAEKRAVGCVNYRIDSFFRNVAYFDDDSSSEKRSQSLHEPSEFIARSLQQSNESLKASILET